MLTAQELHARRDQVATSADLQAGVAAMRTRLDRLLRQAPIMPVTKALLSVDGGLCPEDGAQLQFDPWSPTEHRCPVCQSTWTGERHDRAWARWQHLWLAERAAELATLAALTQDEVARQRAGDILSWYGEHYTEFPNRDNVLGPARVFFSTYLESIWIDNLLSAAVVLGDAGLLDDSAATQMARLADEAAGVIGEFDEQLSNRQIWNNAALLGIAVWFEDEGLAHRCIEGTSGVIAQLLHGFGSDGLWYEGENYHFFALQGLLHSAGWARLAGVDLFAEPELVDPLHRALLVARETALPDLTYPARKDSRFGVSLAQPMFLESWEIGLGRAAAAPSGAPPELATWLRRLYAQQTPQGQLLDSYLHEIDHAPMSRSRSDLSWRTLLEMLPDLPDEDGSEEAHGGRLLESHGLAILKSPARYVSLECGAYGGGHGHPDRLHLTVHAAGVAWLLDQGTGSYVSEDLKYYRSSVGHNAPFLNGESQPPGNARCEAFDVDDDWGWIQGSYGDLRRTVVAGPDSIVDVVEFVGEEERLMEIPWHFLGKIEVLSPGEWVPDQLDHPRTSNSLRFDPSEPGSIEARIVLDDAYLSVQFQVPGTLWLVEGPGPSDGAGIEFLLVRCTGRHLRCVTSLDWVAGHTLEATGDLIEIRRGDLAIRHQAVTGGWHVEDGDNQIRLTGTRATRADRESVNSQQSPLVVHGVAQWRAPDPDIDGSLSGFADGAPLHLDHDDQYRRSEMPYGGPADFSAVAYPAWGEESMYLAVAVTKPDTFFRGANAAALRLDNEPDDIHCDGVQVYLTSPDRELVFACIAVPEPGSQEVNVRIAQGEGSVRGTWSDTPDGYCLTLSVTPSWWDDVRSGDEIGFDLIVNESRQGQDRRAGQLVWSGGGGWVWLRGDRQDPSRFGTLELR